ncbi:MAG: hypothetical protein Q9157_005137 [Trypethelium eluteriae]
MKLCTVVKRLTEASIDSFHPSDDQLESQSEAYEHTSKPFSFIGLPVELRLAVYEELLDGAVVAIGRSDKFAPAKTHAVWSLALTCKKIRSELVEVMIKLEKFRFIYPLRLLNRQNPEVSDVDFVLQFLRDAAPDLQNKILSSLNIRIGYNLMRSFGNTLMIHVGLGREISLLHQNLTEIRLELPACPLIRPTRSMVRAYPLTPVPPFPLVGIGSLSREPSAVHWPGEGERGIDLNLRADRTTTQMMTLLDCHSELDFYEKQARHIHVDDGVELVESLNLSLPSGSLWKLQPQSCSLEVGFVNCRPGYFMWVSRSFFNLKLQRSTSDSKRADLDFLNPGMFPKSRERNDVDNLMRLYSDGIVDRTEHPAKVTKPYCQHPSEPCYPRACKKDGVYVVSRLEAYDGFMG